MLNILSLMVLLSAPADAHHKAHKAPPPKHKHHATAHRHTPLHDTDTTHIAL